METQLAAIDEIEVRLKVARCKALNLRELAVAVGLGYTAMRELAKEQGFPILRGNVWHEDFVLWRRARMGLPTGSHTASHPHASTSDKFWKSKSSRG